MLITYLNTIDSEFYDADGNLWRDTFPKLIVGGHEEIKVILCTNTDNASSSLADPSTWERDTSYANVEGIGALLTVDNDNIHYIKGTLSAAADAGAMSVSATITQSDYSTIPDAGTLRLFNAAGEYEIIAYNSRNVTGNIVTFELATALVNACDQGATLDVHQAPICQAYMDATKGNLAAGELVFNLVCDSDRLRSMTDYSNAASISIRGIELLFYVTDTDNYIKKLRAYLWDTPSLSNSMGEPGFSAPLPDSLQDTVVALVKTIVPDNIYSSTELDNLLAGKANTGDVYTKTEIDDLIGDIETLLAEI